MFDNLMQNLYLNAKNKIEEEKKALAEKKIDFISSDKKISIKLNGNLEILDLSINDDILKEDKEIIEDLLVVNINKAMNKAAEIREKELKEVKDGLMPDMNNIFNSFSDEVDQNQDNDDENYNEDKNESENNGEDNN